MTANNILTFIKQRSRFLYPELRSVIVNTTIALVLIYGMRHLGLLQRWELAVFDQMMRVRPAPAPDPRLLVVEITEQDIAAQQQWPLSDQTLAQVLAELNQHQAAAIGLDLARNIPQEPGHAALVAQLSRPNLIAAMSQGNEPGQQVAPPPNLPAERIGIVDVPQDPDGVLRRMLLFTDRPSLSIQLLLTYLRAGCPGYQPRRAIPSCQTLTPQLTPQKDYQLGTVVFPRLKSDSGGYQSINSGGYQLLINYRGQSSTLRRVTLTQVLQHQVAPDWIRGKIVLIGVSAPSLKDIFLTPYSVTLKGTEMMPGVEVQAHMTSQLLGVVLDGEQWFWFWSEAGELAWILLWAIVGLLLAWYARKPLNSLLTGTVLLLLLGGCSFLLFLQQAWVPVVAPALALILVGGTTLLQRQYQFQQQQQMILRLLGQHTSPEIAKVLWQERDRLLQDGRLPWQKLIATVLFTDIKGFSTIAERESPERVMGWLNEYLTTMAEVVQAHQGIVNQFVGDSVMAVFGVPIPRQQQQEIALDAQRSVACALAMKVALRELNQRFRAEGLPPIQMRVGVFTGVVMVGSLGGKSRLEYGVIGDSVNTASRLESCEKERQGDDCRILIAKETLDYLDSQFLVESWGPLVLKGKQRVVEVYRVLGSS